MNMSKTYACFALMAAMAASPAEAQTLPPNVSMRETYWYWAAEVGSFNPRCTVGPDGGAFSRPAVAGDFLPGSVLGYAWRPRLALETGVFGLPAALSYRYAAQGYTTERTGSYRYFYFPVRAAVQLMAPGRRVGLWLTAGGGPGAGNGGGSGRQMVSLGPNYLPRQVDEFWESDESRAPFAVFETGLRGEYRFTRHFSVALVAKQLWGPGTVRQARVRVNDEAVPNGAQTVELGAKVRSLSVGLGAAYRFHWVRKYRYLPPK